MLQNKKYSVQGLQFGGFLNTYDKEVVITFLQRTISGETLYNKTKKEYVNVIKRTFFFFLLLTLNGL